MTELQAIARLLRRPEEELRVPFDLIRQGYDAEFLATYRRDETGQLDREIMVRMKRALTYVRRLQSHRESVQKQLEAEQLWSTGVAELVNQAGSIAEIDLLTRGLRSRRGSRAFIERQAEVSRLGELILTMQGEAPADLDAWIAEQANVSVEEGKNLLGQVRRWLQLLLHEEAGLLDRIARQLRRRCLVSVEVLQTDPNAPDPADSPLSEATSSDAASSDANLADANGNSSDANGNSPVEPAQVALESSQESVLSSPAPAASLSQDDQSVVAKLEAASLEVADVATSSSTEEGVSTTDIVASAPAALGGETEVLSFAPPKKPGRKGKRTNERVSRSESKLSPRQRRRRWLKGVVESYSRLRKPLDRLTPYQVLMLGRGQRSQLIKLHFEYDKGQLVQWARESLSPGRHSLHHWLLETAEEGLIKHILPKLEQDLFAEYEEAAQQELIDAAAMHLESALVQRPVRNVPVLAIDAIGPKLAAIAVIDERGEVVHTDEIPCNSSRSDLVASVVTQLGEIIHRFKVPLIALSNGPARRYLVHSVKELLSQSNKENSKLWWTMVDRTGADAYAATRLCLKELPKISRRHRSAVWIGRRLQDPLHELLKINPAQLRLGSYQRELPDQFLQECLDEVVSSVIARKGIDVVNASERTLNHLPGVSPELAHFLVELRDSEGLQSRAQIWEKLRDKWPEFQYRQAIPSLRLFGVEEVLDATAIHPEDYRLAERLISNAGLPAPANAPEGWSKRDVIPDAPQPGETSSEENLEGAEGGEATGFAEELLTEKDSESSSLESTEEHSAESMMVSSDSTENADATPSVDEATSEDANAVSMADQLNEANTEVASDLVESENALTQGEPTTEDAAMAAVGESDGGSAVSVVTEVATETVEPVNRVRAMQPPPFMAAASASAPVTIDVEKLARSWSVGRGRMRYVARCLQQPFADFRDAEIAPPMLDRVPTLEDLKPGMSLWAVVIGVAEFGAFADMGPDCSGLIHISRLARTYVDDPHQAVQVGDLVKVWVVDVDQSKRRVALSALPPGVQPIRLHADANQEEQRRGNGPGRPQDGARRGNQRPDQQRSGGGGNRGGAGPNRNDGRGPGNAAAQRGGGGDRGRAGGQGGYRGQGGNRGGSQDRGRGRGNQHRDHAPSNETIELNEKKVKIHQPKPSKPISDAMQDGREPLRSFSDLMQYYQVKRDPSEGSAPEASSDSQANPSEE